MDSAREPVAWHSRATRSRLPSAVPATYPPPWMKKITVSPDMPSRLTHSPDTPGACTASVWAPANIGRLRARASRMARRSGTVASSGTAFSARNSSACTSCGLGIYPSHSECQRILATAQGFVKHRAQILGRDVWLDGVYGGEYIAATRRKVVDTAPHLGPHLVGGAVWQHPL